MAGEKFKDLFDKNLFDIFQNTNDLTINNTMDAPVDDGKTEWIFGRGEGCDFTYCLPKVSRQHFKIEYIDSHYYISDLGSTNGTYLNGKRIEHMERIFAGDIISIGGVDIVFTKSLLKCKHPSL